MKRIILNSFKILTISVLVIYLSVCGFLYFGQESLLFHPSPKSLTEVMQIMQANPQFDTINFTMKDQINISGYISKNRSQTKLPLVIYFEGNTEEVSHLMDKHKYFENSVIALINYRGFGLSEGKPSEKTMFSDAVEVYDKLKRRSDIDSNRIIVIGRSIGTGVATYLSSQRRVAETILITPYDSMIDLAQEKYPFVPIFMIIKHPFESNKYAQSITNNMLALIAKNDVVIPTKHAWNLMRAWNGQTSYLEVDEDHSSIMDNELVWKKIEENINKK